MLQSGEVPERSRSFANPKPREAHDIIPRTARTKWQPMARRAPAGAGAALQPAPLPLLVPLQSLIAYETSYAAMLHTTA